MENGQNTITQLVRKSAHYNVDSLDYGHGRFNAGIVMGYWIAQCGGQGYATASVLQFERVVRMWVALRGGNAQDIAQALPALYQTAVRSTKRLYAKLS